MFAERNSGVYELAVPGMRIYGLGFLFSGINIFSAIRMMVYGKGHFSGVITFLRSFVLLLLFLILLPAVCGINGIWLAVPAAEFLTLFVSIVSLIFVPGKSKMEFNRSEYREVNICQDDKSMEEKKHEVYCN